MAKAACVAMAKPRLRAYADRGYFNAPQIKECADAGIEAFVPKPTTSPYRPNARVEDVALKFSASSSWDADSTSYSLNWMIHSPSA
jgi:hypothetical protein